MIEQEDIVTHTPDQKSERVELQQQNVSEDIEFPQEPPQNDIKPKGVKWEDLQQ